MYSALAATSETLSEFLQAELASVLANFNNGTMTVEISNPHTMEQNGSLSGLSLWLYRIARDAERLNAPPNRPSPDEVEYHPLPMRLYYLLTPIVRAANNAAMGVWQTEQFILGRVLQALNDQPRLSGSLLQGDFAGSSIELFVRFEPMNLEETTRVWDALQTAYRLSVSYEVTVVLIRSAMPARMVQPVHHVLSRTGTIISSESESGA